MVKVFLDVNILIDLVEKRRTINSDQLDGFNVFLTPLSAHILLYVLKKKIPFPRLSAIIDSFSFVNFNEKIALLALVDPTNDFEDNVQLHSAAEADCDIFLTFDKKLLSMKFFGKVKIIKPEDFS